MLAKARMSLLLLTLLMGLLLVVGNAAAVMVNQLAPDFTLPSTAGGDISLSQFRGNKMVLIEFYAIDSGST